MLARLFLIMFAIKQIPYCECQSSLSPIHGGYIRDLTGDTTELAAYVNQWTATGTTSLSPFSCNTYVILGQPGFLSYGGTFQRTYSQLPSHSYIFYSITLFVMDQWMNSDYYEIKIDDVSVFKPYPNYKKAASGSHICGDASKLDLIDVAVGKVSHSSPTLNIKIVTSITNSPTYAWLGVKDVMVFLSNQTSVTQSKCSFYSSGGTDTCACQPGLYRDTSLNLCQPCHTNCLHCFGPTEADCYACNSLKSFDGTQCIDAGVANCAYFDFVNMRCSLCSGSYKLYPNGTCLTTCSSPYLTETVGGYSFCKTPCQANNTFMLWDNTCGSSCNLPLIQRNEGSAKFCDFPCSPSNLYLYSNFSCLGSCDFFPRLVSQYNLCDNCPGGGFMYANHTCLPTCLPPRISSGQDGYNLCILPCQLNNTFMLWDNSCSESCDFPLIQRIESQDKFCDYPCSYSTNLYLYSNGSCLSSCDFFSRRLGGYSFCDGCPGGSFMYPNRSCLPTCLSPRITKGIDSNGYNYCLSPCNSSMEYYYLKEGECRSGCQFPYRVDDSFFCILDISEEATKALEGLSDVLGSTAQITSATITISNLVTFSNPSAVLFGSMNDLIQNIKYLKINYPPKLQYILDQPESGGYLEMIFSMPKEIESGFIKQDLPEKFKQHDIHSSFFVNFWEAYMIISVIIALIILINLCKRWTTKYAFVQSLILRIQQIFQWNFLISFLIGYYGNLAFYSALEVESLHLYSFCSVISFLICIFTNIFALAFLIYITIILAEIITTKIQDTRSSIFKRINIVKEKWKEYGIVFESFKDESFMKQAFLLFFIIRLYIFNTFIVSLLDYPLSQTILATVISFLMLLYLIKIRPFREKRSWIENLVQESCLQIVNICVLILASLDAAGCEAVDGRELIGNIIISVNTGFTLVGSLYLNVQLLLSLKNLYTKFRKQQKMKKEIKPNSTTEFGKEKIHEKNFSENAHSKQTKLKSSQLLRTLELQNTISLTSNFSSIDNAISKPLGLKSNRFLTGSSFDTVIVKPYKNFSLMTIKLKPKNDASSGNNVKEQRDLERKE